MPKRCFFCGKEIETGIQYLMFKRDIVKWDWSYHAETIGSKAGNPAFCEDCNKRFLEFLNKNKYEEK